MKRKPVVAADARSLLLQGRREFLISGEIHYPRVPRAEWERVLDRTKEAGVNCVASYVFWGLHEPRPDVYDFSGQAGLGDFIKLCAERDLHCIIRMGPYCCAEWNYGGFPAWLRDIPGIVIRTWNEPYLERVKKYFRVLVSEILPHLASRGGNVILVQIENEYNNVAKRYGADGRRYLAWLVGYVKSLGIDVPTITCEGGAPGAIEGVNGFSVHEVARRHRRKHPRMPLLWTENWPSWYDTWGSERHVRDPYENGYEILRFVAEGGSGFNYYMWHGGTNFGRTSMYLQTTSYDFDGPLNEWGEPTEKSRVLSGLHRALSTNQEILLAGRKQTSCSEDGKVLVVRWNHATGACFLTINARDESLKMSPTGKSSLVHPPHSACLWKAERKGARLLWKSWPGPSKRGAGRSRPAGWKAVKATSAWSSFPEPRPSRRRYSLSSVDPVEQILLTRDSSDYCWYATELRTAQARRATLRIERGGDFFYVFVNGRLVDRTRGPLEEIRGPTLPSSEVAVIAANPLEERVIASGRNGYEHTFSIPLRAGQNRIEILACALGLIKGDWQLALSMQYERKGIWSTVSIDGRKLQGWRHYPGLIGEKLHLSEPLAGDYPLVSWARRKKNPPLTWHLLEFRLTARQLDPRFVWAFDAAGLDKGTLWLNGHQLGRVWQMEASGRGADPLPPLIGTEGAGGPTQPYYRIPSSWLRPKNRLIFLSENGAKPSPGALLCRPYGG